MKRLAIIAHDNKKVDLVACRESFGEDLTELFNLLTGYTRPRRFNHLVVAPTDLRDGLVMRIRREADHARAGRPARIIAKLNSLGLSERIRAVSIVDRFLEHARIFYFGNHDAPEYLLASADWMPRNLDRRVEIAFPVLDAGLCAQIAAILDVQLGDTVKARVIRADGTSQRISASSALRSQERLWELTQPLRS
ncbi:MAG: hypothetical protein ACRELZ_11620 [Candidatus Rokuibacteriota bacterium]